MRRARMLFPKITVGLDVGDKMSVTCEVDWSGEVVRRSSVATTVAGMESYFAGRERCRVVLEVGTHSPWLSRQLQGWGHEVIVANPSAMYTKGHRRRRNDHMDAEFLARQGRADAKLLRPIEHRGAQAQQDLAWLRARDQLVGVRTKLINHVRGRSNRRVDGWAPQCRGLRAARAAGDPDLGAEGSDHSHEGRMCLWQSS